VQLSGSPRDQRGLLQERAVDIHNEQPIHRPKGRLRYLLLGSTVSLVTLVLMLLLAEMALQLTGEGPLEIKHRRWRPTRAEIFEVLADPPHFRHRPNVSGEQVYYRCRRGECWEDMRVPFETNSHGHRGGEYTLKKSEGTFRVLFLGDSFTVGEGTPVEESWPQVVGELLRERLGPQRPVEIINTAVVGYSTFDQWVVLRDHGLEFEPDIIVVGFYLNDIQWFSSRRAATAARPKTSAKYDRDGSQEDGHTLSTSGVQPRMRNVLPRTQWTHPIRLLRFVDAALYARSSKIEAIAIHRKGWSPKHERKQRYFSDALDSMAVIQAKRDIPFLFVVWPWLHSLDETYPFGGIHLTIEHNLDTRGLRMLSLLEPFSSLDEDTPLWIHESDHHPSVALQRIAADLIVERLTGDLTFGVTTGEDTEDGAP
jgi:lysophospholipase L1-like esterase